MKYLNLQVTLGIIKPDASRVPHALQVIKSVIDRESLGIVQHKFTQLKLPEAERFYYEHRSKFFYHRLVTFMTSGPLIVLILSHKNAIKKWRQVMGPTKVFRTHLENPKSIRGMIGLTDTRNATHGSDSLGTAIKEISFFFPEFSYEDWKQKGCPVATFSTVLKNLREEKTCATRIAEVPRA